MQTYEMYFSGSSEPDPKLPFAPTPEEMYNDFIDVMKSSGYTIRTAQITRNTHSKHWVIEVSGMKT